MTPKELKEHIRLQSQLETIKKAERSNRQDKYIDFVIKYPIGTKMRFTFQYPYENDLEVNGSELTKESMMLKFSDGTSLNSERIERLRV